MVLLQHHLSSRKRPSSNAFVPPFAQPPKIPKSNATVPATAGNGDNTCPGGKTNAVPETPPPPPARETLSPIDRMASTLADAGCTLINLAGPPCLPSDTHKLRYRLHRLFSSDFSLRSDFLSGFSSYIHSPHNLRRVLITSNRDSFGSTRSDSLVRVLLLVPSIQVDFQNLLLEKLPEYFDLDTGGGLWLSSSSLDEDIARLILNQFRWLDFFVDSEGFTEKLLQVLSICPIHLKKEIIGSLPEIIGDNNNKAVVDSIEQLLHEDSAIIVASLDALSNLNLDDQLREQVVMMALSCLRTIDAEHLPYLLRFLLLSATPTNARRIISQIREQLKFIGISNVHMMQGNKHKGKLPLYSAAASILDALRSSLRFKNVLCQEILKELNHLEKARDHKVIDIWLLILIYMNGESMQKSVEKMLKKKIVDGCFQDIIFDQCIQGNKELVQDYFPSYLSLSEYLVACKEKKAREIGIHLYTSLFKEFPDTYSRQEILGALVTHMSSGISFEVGSALETMVLLASKCSQDLIPLSSHISGILDYLEGFNVENLHKVYQVFGFMVMSARSSRDSFGSSIANELLMIVQKQISNPDLKYKKMGLIGTMKMVSCLGDANNATCLSCGQRSNDEEALELLKTSLDSCKQSPLPYIMFYDELIAILDHKTLHPAIMDWIGLHLGEFESVFLSDLENGLLPVKNSYCGLEGELWMNLDGDISPICVNILPLASSSLLSASSLLILSPKFLLLSVIERLANQGSLAGIDALLGCPLHLPSSKIFLEPTWQTLTEKQKKIVCLSLYYAANWMRELLNAFCTQVAGEFECVSQTTKEEIIAKLLKRLRNLVFLESLLISSLRRYPLSLPELDPHVEHYTSSFLNQHNYAGNLGKKGKHVKRNENSPNREGKSGKASTTTESSHVDRKFKQPSILDAFRKAGGITSQEMSKEDRPGVSFKSSTSESAGDHGSDSNGPVDVEVSAAAKVLEAQRHRFRPLLIDCFFILAFSKKQDSCCPDPAAELPLYLYLLRDLHYKLDCFSPPGKQFSARYLSSPPGLSRMSMNDFLRKIQPVFPCLKKHLNCAVGILKEGTQSCQDHWKLQSASAGIPDLTNIVVSPLSVSSSVVKEVLCCFRGTLNLLDVQTEKSILLDLLEAFQPINIPNDIFSGMQITLTLGNIDYSYCGAYYCLEAVLDKVISFSFMLASEVLLALDSVITSIRKFLDMLFEGNVKDIHRGFIKEILPTLHSRLRTSAQKLLKNNWNDDHVEKHWSNKGEIMKKILHIYLENDESASDLLEELACSVLPQVSSCKTAAETDSPGFPTLRSATFVAWYRAMHEENLAILNKLVKEVCLLEKSRSDFQPETVERVLNKLKKSVNVVVSLVSMCRTHEKISVHTIAVKHGGKFVDSFLKVFDFLQTHFETHNELIIQLVKELQKATRTIQSLCSEAKGLKQTTITSKIPATKRSMERFLFRVKALFHTTLSGRTLWIGNLKHKDLTGQVVSSQAYLDDQNENIDEYPAENVSEFPANSAPVEEDRETE